MTHEIPPLTAGLLRLCKELLGRIRVLEEVVASNPELAAELTKQRRFLAAFEEDEFASVRAELQSVLEALEEPPSPDDGSDAPTG